MSQTTSALSQLVNLLNDSIAFYDEASSRIKNPAYTQLFGRMRLLKTTIAADLNAEIVKQGALPQSEGTLIGSIRMKFADAVADLADHPRYSFVEQLEAQEARVLEAFSNASSSDSSETVRALATQYLPEIQKMHQEILELKKLSALQVNNI